ncbi:hypothetical protein H7X46_08340 [Pseudonocardia sp. C8]|uniref:hypothetical protein n=1 Tax=Pseudonocardia sp. C8 TaxID=2762759 RepID=UPI0016426047|nr:hypothetical protein [Pseudonocardia sp. C8]MBC3191070.1 hypothetical protein [Pseudonocardia sp. C8]
MPTDLIVRGAERIGAALVAGLDDGPGGPRDGEQAAPVDGDPVLLVGGFATTPPLLGPMARWLSALGYAPTPVAIGAGLDCGQRSVDALTERVRERADRTGRPVRLLGHSRGGQFARAAGARTPGHVAGLVTLGTPFDLYGLAVPTMGAMATVAVAGTIGLPRLARLSCLFGECCRRFRSELRAPWPDGTPFTSIYSRADRVVPARASIDPSASNVEVPGTHNGLLLGRTAHRAIAEALARCEPAPAAEQRGGALRATVA